LASPEGEGLLLGCKISLRPQQTYQSAPSRFGITTVVYRSVRAHHPLMNQAINHIFSGGGFATIFGPWETACLVFPFSFLGQNENVCQHRPVRGPAARRNPPNKLARDTHSLGFLYGKLSPRKASANSGLPAGRASTTTRVEWYVGDQLGSFRPKSTITYAFNYGP